MRDPTAEFFDELGRRGHEPLLEQANGTMRVEIVDGKRTSSWSVAIKKGDLTVTQTGVDADSVATADKSLFDGIVSGEVNAMAAILRGDLRVEGDPELLVHFQRLFPGPPASARRHEGDLAVRQAHE